MKIILTLILAGLFLVGCQEKDAAERLESSEETASSNELSVSPTEEQTSSEVVEETVSYEYRINPNIFTVEPLADADTEVVLLTFDDAPQPPDSQTLDIARKVQEKGANAIFFVMGQFLETEEAKEIVKSVYDMGFELGNHSYSHPDMSSLSYEEQMVEIIQTNDLIEEITGSRPRFFRAPYGAYNRDTEVIAEAENMTLMNWTYGYDWVEGYMEAGALAEIMVHAPELGSGGNLLMHDRPWTSEAIEGIIDGLREQGYEIVDPKLIETPGEE